MNFLTKAWEGIKTVFAFLVGLVWEVKAFWIKNQKLIGTVGTVLKFVLAEVALPPALLKGYEFIRSNAQRIKVLFESRAELGPLRFALANCQTTTNDAAWECLVREIRSHILQHPEYVTLILRTFTSAIVGLLKEQDSSLNEVEVPMAQMNAMAEEAYYKQNGDKKWEKKLLKDLSASDRIKYNQFYEKLK